MANLRVKHGRGEPFDVAIEAEVFSIGRGPANELHFHSPWLSRVHAQIVARNGRHVLIDQESRNGTFLNGRPVRGEAPLEHGDRIAIGDIQLRFMTSAGALHVSDDGSNPLGQGTVLLASDELSFDRYREPSGAARGVGSSLFPALNAAASALLVHRPLDRLVEKVLELILQAVPAERAALMLRRGDRDGLLEIEAVRGYEAGNDVEISRTIIDTVVGERQAVLTLDAQTDNRFDHAQSILLQGIRSIICVPLWNNRDVIGVIYLDQRSAGRVFGKDDLRLVGLIANMAAVKIENAQLLADQLERERLKQQMAVGAQIQRKLLPEHDPEVPGYDISGVNRSCFEIGGDYFDFIPRKDGRMAVVVADISGKGIGAALLMAVLQASLRALIRSADSAHDLVQRLNDVLIENSPYNKFATLFFAELDPVEHTLTYVNGGHNAGLLRSAGGVELLSSTGPIVGMIETAQYSSRTVTLAPGDVVLLYTDGVTEATDEAGEEYGIEQLTDLLERSETRLASDLMAEVIGEVREFATRGRMDDDTTVVVVRRLPEG